MFAPLRYLPILSPFLIGGFALAEPESEALERALSHNAYIRQDFTAHSSDIQGKLAAGADVSLQSYGVASLLEVDATEPTLISGGNVSYDNGMMFQGSILAAGSVDQVSETVVNGMKAGATVGGNASTGIDFASDFAALSHCSLRQSPPARWNTNGAAPT